MSVIVMSAAALLWMWAISDVLALDDRHLHPGEKGTWIAIVMALPVLGAIAWLIVGRPATQ